MTLTQIQRSTYMLPSMDGCVGWWDGTYNNVTFGWPGGTTTVKKHYRSSDYGYSWEYIGDAPFNAHCVGTAVKNNVLYTVNGDPYNLSVGGALITASYKCVAGIWSQIAADCGLNGDSLGCLVYYSVTDGFYYFGGQQSFDPADGVSHTIRKSTDNCASFSTVVADTRTAASPWGFKGGHHWLGWCEHEGKLWGIGRAIYNNSGILREYDTSIWTLTDDGTTITLTYAGEFPGVGKHYHNVLSHNGRIWVIGGYNTSYGANLDAIWSASVSGSRLGWRSEGNSSFSGRHAMTCWSTPQGIQMFGGTSDVQTERDGWWLYERAATPVASPAAGTFAGSQSVTLSCATSGASIYYTTDGSEPDSTDTLYSGPIAVSSTTTIRAVAIKDGLRNSDITRDTFFIGSEAGVLDGISNIWLAVSTRRLLTSWSGNIAKVRRSSDNTTADVGASGFELDTAALTAHVGAGDGFIDTLYDQSGNGRNMAQATTTYQPRCVVSGSLVSGWDNALAIRNVRGEVRSVKNAGTVPDAYTICMWVKAVSIQLGTQVIVDVGGGGIGAIQHKGSSDNTEDRLRALVSVGADQIAYAAKWLFKPGEWAHLAMTYDGLNVLKLYINTELAATNSATGNVSASQAALEWLGVANIANIDFGGDAQDLVVLSVAADQATIRAIAKR